MAKSQGRLDDYRWDDVRVFLALLRAGTLGGAATRLGVDATTVGRRLTALEETLGTALFDRTRDGVVPTPAAERLLPLAEETERAAGELLAGAQSFERSPAGVVRLTTPPVLAEAFVMPILAELFVRYPLLRVELNASTAIADLSRREADLALRVRKPESGDLVVVKLLETSYHAYASPALAERVGILTVLNDAPWVGWTVEMNGIPPARWARANIDEASVTLRSGTLTAHVAAAKVGLAVALLPRFIGELNGLVALATRGEAQEALARLPPEIVWMVGHRALRDVPRVAAVWDLFLERAASLQGAAPSPP